MTAPTVPESGGGRRWRFEARWHYPRGLLFGVMWNRCRALNDTCADRDWDVSLHLGPCFLSVGYW